MSVGEGGQLPGTREEEKLRRVSHLGGHEGGHNVLRRVVQESRAGVQDHEVFTGRVQLPGETLVSHLGGGYRV